MEQRLTGLEAEVFRLTGIVEQLGEALGEALDELVVSDLITPTFQPRLYEVQVREGGAVVESWD